jgi:hypothetical protein
MRLHIHGVRVGLQMEGLLLPDGRHRGISSQNLAAQRLWQGSAQGGDQLIVPFFPYDNVTRTKAGIKRPRQAARQQGPDMGVGINRPIQPLFEMYPVTASRNCHYVRPGHQPGFAQQSGGDQNGHMP